MQSITKTTATNNYDVTVRTTVPVTSISGRKSGEGHVKFALCAGVESTICYEIRLNPDGSAVVEDTDFSAARNTDFMVALVNTSVRAYKGGTMIHEWEAVQGPLYGVVKPHEQGTALEYIRLNKFDNPWLVLTGLEWNSETWALTRTQSVDGNVTAVTAHQIKSIRGKKLDQSGNIRMGLGSIDTTSAKYAFEIRPNGKVEIAAQHGMSAQIVSTQYGEYTEDSVFIVAIVNDDVVAFYNGNLVYNWGHAPAEPLYGKVSPAEENTSLQSIRFDTIVQAVDVVMQNGDFASYEGTEPESHTMVQGDSLEHWTIDGEVPAARPSPVPNFKPTCHVMSCHVKTIPCP